MLNLKDLLCESMINESANDYIFIWNHFEPSTLYRCTGDVKKLEKHIADYDFETFTGKSKSNLIGFAWNDEYGFAWDIDGSNLNSAKSKDLKYIEDQINQQKDQIEQENYMYIESNIFGGANEWYDEDVSTDAKEIQKRFIDMIENSEVDGDSSFGRIVIDVKKNQLLLGGENTNITSLTVDEFIEDFLQE